jgi:hypothetical protein
MLEKFIWKRETMADDRTDGYASSGGSLAQDAVSVIQHIGQSLNMASLYGVSHKVARTTFERSHAALESFLARHGSAHITATEGELLVNSVAVSSKVPLAGALIKRLTAMSLSSFVIEPGFSVEEFEQLLALFLEQTAPGATGAAADMLQARGLQHVQAKNVTYQQVGADEKVVQKEEESVEPKAATRQSSAPAPSAADLDNVVAFLKSEDSAKVSINPEVLREVASDSEKMAEMILRAVELRRQMADLSTGESLGDLVVGCINRVTTVITSGSTVKTQKNSKQLKRTLLMLEKSLADKLRSLSGDDAAAEVVTEAVEELAGALDTEALAAKYVKDRRAASQSEARLRRMIDKAADDPTQAAELRETLLQQGLPPEGWQELTLSRKPATPQSHMEGVEAGEIKTLTLLLTKLGEVFDEVQKLPPKTDPATLRNVVAETGQQIDALASVTEKKIAALRQMASEAPDPSDPEDRRLILSRKQLLKTLAEIAQELSQPVSVVSTSIAMLRTCRTGPISEIQGELLALAASSGERLAYLVNCLKDLSGMPLSLHPDQKTLGSIYGGTRS